MKRSQSKKAKTENVIREVPLSFANILIKIDDINKLTEYNTFIAWRLGTSERFLNEALLPLLRGSNTKFVVPAPRLIQLSDSWDVEQRKLTDGEPKNIDELFSPLSSYITVFDVVGQDDGSKVIGYLINHLNSEVSRDDGRVKIIVLVEVFGSLNRKLIENIRKLMCYNGPKSIAVWLHAEVSSVPISLLARLYPLTIFEIRTAGRVCF